MSDLVLTLNFDESKKKKRIILETYEGFIPKLKSKKYSGQLRNININSSSKYDNINSIQLREITDCLNSINNIQISKHQYIIDFTTLKTMCSFIDYKCLFYKDKKIGMYLVESIDFDLGENKKNSSIGSIEYLIKKTHVSFCIHDIEKKEKLAEVKAKAYIDVNSKKYDLKLFFNYDGFLINSMEKRNESKYLLRDYAFEERIKEELSFSNWKNTKEGIFLYEGKNIESDINKLWNAGIDIFTNNDKPILKTTFNNVSMSYDIDWFELDGSIDIDGESVSLSDLISFNKHKDTWIEYKGKILLIPSFLNNKKISLQNSKAIIRKENFFDAMLTSNQLGVSKIKNIEELIEYSKTELELEDSVLKTLRDYQKIGVKWLKFLKSNCFGGCLADDMGLGKTLQIIAFLNDASQKGNKNLIIAPKTLITNWEREFKKFSPNTKVNVYHGQNRSITNKATIIITTFQTLVNDIDLMNKFHFNNVIVDEAQYIKNSQSKAYKAIKAMNADTKYLLTGTPMENNIHEYISLMTLINPAFFSSKNNLADECSFELLKKMTSPFVLRRLKKDVLSDLPEKQEQIVYVSMDEEQRYLYDTVLNSIQYEINRKADRFEVKDNSILLTGLLYLQEICCHPSLLNDVTMNINGCNQSAKLDVFLEITKNLYQNNHKIVVFSRFTKMLKIMEEKLLKEHMCVFYLDGTSKNRLDIVDEFESSSDGVFLISLKAGGTGLNLTSADVGIIYDPWWNPATEKQAEDRIYRIGQQKNVIIYKLVVENTIEEKVKVLQDKKSKLFNELMENQDNPDKISMDEMRKLLME